MSDRWAIALWASVALGAWQARSIDYVWLIVVVVVALLLRQRALLLVAAVCCVSDYAAHEWRALDAPLASEVAGVAILVTDPNSVNRGTGAEISLGARHYQVWAYGSTGYRLRSLQAGDRIRVAGETRELSGLARSTYRRRHIAGSLTLTQLSLASQGNEVDQAANYLRRLVAGGASSMPDRERALLTGFIYGDDREEDAETKEDFLAANMSHLLAVSGSNVAFVLLLAAPLLKRFGYRGRFVGGGAVLILFGVITRWEPSVVRAEMMAFVALIAVAQGRAISKWQCLALGSTFALIADPFLIGSVGFLLSVSACLGMASLGERLQVRLRGSIWLRRAIAYSASAQLGVAPVQWIIFHELPTVGLLTNVLAEPLAGAVMVWGVVGGLIAGLMPGPVAYVLHLPDTVMLRVVWHIAHYGAALESTNAGRTLAVVLTGLLLVVLGQRRPGTNLDSDGRSSTVDLPD